MKNILVPTDFSANADFAFDFALQLAQKAGGELHLLHTYTTTSHAGHLSNIDRIVKVDRQKDMKAYLHKKAEENKSNVKVTGKVRQGEAAELIEYQALNHDISLVVMGTQGANKISKKIWGSTTSNVIKKLDLPVLAVPTEAEGKVYDTLVVALDELKLPALSALNNIVDFIQTMNFKLHLVHISSSEATTDLNPAVKAFFDEKNIIYTYDKVISNNISKGILDYTSATETAMLCLISRKRTWMANIFHTSVSQQVALNATMPVLALDDVEVEAE